ncbi:hypothetical protein [Actinoplanes aureus]|uniref:Uncharacterized protein n=1 Tax=Actinoplanes aureus TaxID=2792083 RepID=A0A931CGV7_9ACTN|nr:hypothetical protein [Actinoplanes aureus]MBG0567322.1 hypothetical protein [Actinoplanes aureus]
MIPGGRHGARSRRGKLHLDTTRMPGGVLRFNVSALSERAARALAEGTRFVELTEDTARDWGYVGMAYPLSHLDVDAALSVPRVRASTRGRRREPADTEDAEEVGDAEEVEVEPAEEAGDQASAALPTSPRRSRRRE